MSEDEIVALSDELGTIFAETTKSWRQFRELGDIDADVLLRTGLYFLHQIITQFEGDASHRANAVARCINFLAVNCDVTDGQLAAAQQLIALMNMSDHEPGTA